MKSLGFLSSFACAALLTVACSADNRRDNSSVADDGAIGTSGDTRTDVAGSDREFVQDMLEGGSAEVQLGQLAIDRAASADVKKFGQTMVAEHTKAGEQLKQIAIQQGVQPDEPPALDDKHKDLIDKLSKLRGAEFDREYMDAMVNGHQDVIDRLQTRVDERDRSAVATGQAPRDTNVKPEPADDKAEASLNAWAADTLPVAKGHLERAKAINEKLGDRRNTSAANR